jgi:phosphoglycolate phosphatase
MAALTIRQSDIHTVIFDFDGTLAKLNIDFQQMRVAVMEIISSYGITGDELHTRFVLEMIDGAFEILNRRPDGKAQSFLTEANTVIEKIEVEAAHRGELFEHTRELLASLQAMNISCGIITRNCARAVRIVFPDILSCCPVVVCRDDVSKVKPHPEHISLALKKLGSSPDSALMVGDHPIDIKTGRNVGTKTCGVLTGRCRKNDFIDEGADIVLSHAAQLLNIIG